MPPSDDAIYSTLQDLTRQQGELTGTLKTYMEGRKQVDARLDEQISTLIETIDKVSSRANSAHARIGKMKYTVTGGVLALGFFLDHGVSWAKDLIMGAHK